MQIFKIIDADGRIKQKNHYMKKVIKMLFMAFAMVSCGDKDSGNVPSQPVAPGVISTSIQEGSTIPASVNSLEITYNVDVALTNQAQIEISKGEIKSSKIFGDRKLIVDISLIPGSTYTVTVSANSVVGLTSKKYAPEFKLSFSTEKGPDLSEKVVKSLINPNASAEAKRLYSLLLENYGKRQFSGAMGEVAWGTSFCDYIDKTAGKYPAIVGFDYIHLKSSPANWIDYGDISPVKKIWDAGSIPAMTWHWNVPTSENGSNVSFNAKADEFKASNVLVEGTWENKVAEADVKKLAGYMKLLQDAGIPLLWRPFHEAAGDYKWGAWFWWGNSGVDITKKLWIWLHDKLTNEYGINNLIWVWTVQTKDAGLPASISKMTEAYPGDDEVDIIGTDIYPDKTMTDQTNQFRMLYDLVEGRKIVALTECGNLVDVDSAFANGALWSFFMGWYDLKDGIYGFHQWNVDYEWKIVLNNPLVLSRGDFSL